MGKATQKKMKYEFSHYLMICKTYEMKSAHNVKEVFFSNSEEEFFQEVGHGVLLFSMLVFISLLETVLVVFCAHF